jgi:hypothetical protein
MLKLFQEWGYQGVKENDHGVNSTMIYCKNFCKCHNVPPVQQYDNKNINTEEKNKYPRTYLSVHV